MAEVPKKKGDSSSDVAIQERTRTERARRYAVIFHNDDYTTREFVIEVLMQYFDKTEPEATHIMLSVHYKQRGVAGVFSKDLAETKVDQVHRAAEARGYPLRLTAEPVD
ncbi:MAG: ATP-dependent Clp protease adaptor ClpS [Deltaproteobacteria bacterium]|nr:ATP-dependent Clp protease adaptor ClpS [Deltaproteobacteria bacterium]